MPELPEVETVKNALKEKLVGRVILSALVYWDNIIAYPSRKEFEEKIRSVFDLLFEEFPPLVR